MIRTIREDRDGPNTAQSGIPPGEEGRKDGLHNQSAFRLRCVGLSSGWDGEVRQRG